MRMSLLVFVFFTSKVFSQAPAMPVWGKSDVQFRSTEMKVKDDKTNAVIFDGTKDGTLKISDKSGKIINSVVSVNLPGYFEMPDGIITRCEFKVDKDSKSITYTASNDTKLCVIIVSYTPDGKKPQFIIVSTNDDWRVKTSQKLTFTLDGVK
jgi:hypothetical protein